MYLCYSPVSIFSSHYFFQLCIQKKLHGMTTLLYKIQMILKIRFVNIMKDAELGSASDLMRIPPRYEAGRDQTDHAPLNDLHLHLLEPTTASATIASRSTCMSKNVLVTIDLCQKNWPIRALRTAQALSTPYVKNADCFVCRIDNIFLRACKISNKYSLQLHFMCNPYSRTISLYTHE